MAGSRRTYSVEFKLRVVARLHKLQDNTSDVATSAYSMNTVGASIISLQRGCGSLQYYTEFGLTY